MSGTVLRVLTFETTATDDQIDRLFGGEIAPRPDAVDGLSRTLVARHLTSSTRQYLLATLWSSRDAMTAAVREGEVAVYQAAFAPYLAQAAYVAVDLQAEWWSCEPRGVSMIRLFRDADLREDDGTASGAGVAAVSSDSEADGSACLVLSGADGQERLLLVGWPVGDRPPTGLPSSAVDGLLIELVERLCRTGRGMEYSVTRQWGRLG